MAVLRSSSVVLLALVASGCILAEPVQHNPRQTAPILDLARADPPVTQVLPVDEASTIPFTIPFISEDVGERVWFGLHQNYGLSSQEWADEINFIEPSSLNDDSRAIEFSWTPQLFSDDCFQLTLLVCHERNFDRDTRLCDPAESEDMALATWWVNFGDVAAQPSLLGCPGPAGN